jgi:uncharacterized Zn finger protein (UPF0148 family)
MIEIECLICGKVWEYRCYCDTECPNCGQKYTYEEEDRIVLNEKQIELLKNNYKSDK